MRRRGRNGTVHQIATVGRRDLVSGAPVERNTIFRIASLTKPVTTVCELSLLDEGRFGLDEPITECAPELARMRVLRDPDSPLDQTDQATRPITFRDLLTHRCRLTYGEFHRGPIARAHAETLGAQIDNHSSPTRTQAYEGSAPQTPRRGGAGPPATTRRDCLMLRSSKKS